MTLPRDVVVSALFTSAPDPSGSWRKVAPTQGGASSRQSTAFLLDYIRPWHDTLLLHPGLVGVVLFDELPDEFMQAVSTSRIHFVRATVPDLYRHRVSIYFQRYIALREFLLAHAEVQRIWFIDINDVALSKNPFEWMDNLPIGPSWMLVGEEWSTFRRSEWWKGQLPTMTESYRALFVNKLADMHILCAGIWGASCELALEVTNRFMTEMDDLLLRKVDLTALPGSALEMGVFNYIVYSNFLPRLATFKMESRLEGPISEPGVFLRGVGNPLTHDRQQALSLASRLLAR